MHLPSSPAPFIGLVYSIIAVVAARSHHKVTDSADIFKFPSIVGYFCSFVAAMPWLAWAFWPGLSSRGELDPPMLVALGIATLLCLLSALYFFRYKVVVSDDHITIGAFRRRMISCETIIDWDLIRGSRDSELIVYLKGGERVRLSSMLIDFDELVGMINSHEAIPPRGHPDSEEKRKDREKRARANRTANWLAAAGAVLVLAIIFALHRFG
jgi:hypothetical protein